MDPGEGGVFQSDVDIMSDEFGRWPAPLNPWSDGFPQFLMARTLRLTEFGEKYAQQAKFEPRGILTRVKILRNGEASIEIADF